MGVTLTDSSATADPPSALASRAVVRPGELCEGAAGEGAMGTVHARVRGPATGGPRDLWAGAAGRRSRGCARGSPGKGAPRTAGPGGLAGEAAETLPAGPADLRAGNRYPEGGRDLPKVTQRGGGQKGLAHFPW